jgi:hypothetical protein
MACHLSCEGGINRRVLVRANPGKNTRPYLKNVKVKRPGNVAHVAKHRSSKSEVLSLNPGPQTKRKKKNNY